MITDKTIPAGLSSLNDSQRVIAEDLLSKVERALKSNVEVEMENRVFSIKGAAGCVDKDTEFLTETGWKKISEYEPNDKVAQWDITNSEISFVQPQRYIKQGTEGFYHFKTTTIDMMLSKNHKIPTITSKGHYKDMTAEYASSLSSITIPRSFTINENKVSSVNISDELLRVLVMQSADGSFASDKKTRIRINVKKEAKKVRVLKLLEEAEIKHTIYPDDKFPDWVRVSYNPPSEICTKDLSMLWGCDLRQLHIIYDEIIRWDGSVAQRKNVKTKMFFGVKHNVDFVQYLMSVCSGNYCSITRDKREYKFGDIYTVNEASRNTSNIEIRGHRVIPFIPSEDGLEYCFTTDTGYWLARRNGKIFPTGNCGKSFLTAVLIGELKNITSKMMLTAPTHRALAVLTKMAEEHKIEAKTIHSYLKCKVVENYSTGTLELIQSLDKPIEPVDILFIDESSLVNSALFEMVQTQLFNNTIKVVVFVGDNNQLLPISKDDVNPIYTGTIPLTEYTLTEIVRQAKDNKIIQLVTKIREYVTSQEYPAFNTMEALIKESVCEDIEVCTKIDDFYKKYQEVDYKDSIIACHKNASVASYNKQARKFNLGKVPSIVPLESLVFNESHLEGEEQIHANNEIITVKSCEQCYDEINDIDYWKVVTTRDTMFRCVDQACLVEFNEKLSDIAKDAKKAVGATKTALWQRYFELKSSFQSVSYTYAGTITRLQGGSYPYVFIDFNELVSMANFLSRDDLYRLLYVGLSRASKNVIVFIK